MGKYFVRFASLAKTYYMVEENMLLIIFCFCVTVQVCATKKSI